MAGDRVARVSRTQRRHPPQADRLAAAGHLALAPNLYSAGGVRCLRATFAALSSGRGAALGDIETSRAFLAGRLPGRRQLRRSRSRAPRGGRPARAGPDEAEIEHDVKEYPRAGALLHESPQLRALTVLERVAAFDYHEPSAGDAWARILRLFDRHPR